MEFEMNKKIIGLVMALVMCISSFGGCASNKKVEDESKMTIALLTWITGIDENSFNAQGWSGIEMFAQEYGIPEENYQTVCTMDDDMAIDDIARLADEGTDLIILMGFQFIKPLEYVARKYPNQNFLLVDCEIDQPNVRSATFANNEGSYLAGVTAAMRAQKMEVNRVGFIGGMDDPVLREFEAGYEAGVHEIDPNIEISITYGNDFANPTAGKMMAEEMFDDNVDVVYVVAGATGNGCIEEAVERAKNGEEIYVVGVDEDQFNEGLYNDRDSVVLTSIMKHLDVSVYDTLSELQHGKFDPIHRIYTLKEKGVSLPEKNPTLTAYEKHVLRQYKERIENGDIEIPLVPSRVE